MKRLIVPIALTALMASGCVSTRSQHGYIIEYGETGLEALEGIDSRESVLARFGEPSIRPPLDDQSWYYISQRTQTRAFMQEKVYARTIVAFRFNDEGMVSTVDRYTLEDGEDIELINRATATRGRELNFWQQLLGGVGTVGVPGGGAGGPGQGPGGQPGP